MRYVERTVAEGFLCGILFAAIPIFYVLDSMHRLETMFQHQQQMLDEIKRDLSELRNKQK